MHSMPASFWKFSEVFYFFQRLHIITIGGVFATPSNIYDRLFSKIAKGSKPITIALKVL